MVRLQDSSSGSSDEDWAPSSRSVSQAGASLEGVRRCKVDGCALELTHHKTFFRRARCCPAHARELTVHLDGEAKRLCQQCSSFHPIADFDGTKKSCRTRLESHKIRQREHNNRRMAAAAAAMQRQAAAATAAAAASASPASAPGVQLPHIGGGQVPSAIASLLGQQMPLQAVPPGILDPQPRAPPQQAADALTAQQAALLHAYMTAKRQQQQQPQPPQPPPSAANSSEAPSIFDDIPLHELPLDVRMDRQPQLDQTPVDAYNLSSFWEGPPPAGCQAFNADAVSSPAAAPCIGDMDLGQLLPPHGFFGSNIVARLSVRSQSADAGAACWAGIQGREAAPSRLRSASSQGARSSRRSSASQLLFRGEDSLSVAHRHELAPEEARYLPYKSPFDQSFLAPAHSTGLPCKRPAADEVPGGDSLRTRSIKRPSLNSYDMATRGLFATAKRASIEILRTDSAFEGSVRKLASAPTPGGQHDGTNRRSSLGSRGSGASSPSQSVHSTESAPPRSSVRRHSSFQRCAPPLPRSVKRRSLCVLPDAAGPDAGDHMHDCAFGQQAPEPLLMAAQLVRDMGLQTDKLPDFSYGLSRSASTSPGAALHIADALLPPLAGRSSPEAKTGVDEIGGAALRALLMTKGPAALDEVSQRLRRLACGIEGSQAAAEPMAMARRIRRRSCGADAMRCGMLSLVA